MTLGAGGSMSALYSRVRETADALQALGLTGPVLLLIYWGEDGRDLFPGLETACALRDLPHCPAGGRLLAGAGRILLEDAPSYHDGSSMEELAQLPRSLALLGLDRVLLAGPALYLDERLEDRAGALVADHLNLTGDSPLVGPHEPRLGKRFPDMSEAWSKRLRSRAERAAEDLAEGVLAGLSGPDLETPAQLAYLKRMGADLVDWRFLPENLASVHAGMEVLGFCWRRSAGERGAPSVGAKDALLRVAGAVLDDGDES